MDDGYEWCTSTEVLNEFHLFRTAQFYRRKKFHRCRETEWKLHKRWKRSFSRNAHCNSFLTLPSQHHCTWKPNVRKWRRNASLDISASSATIIQEESIHTKYEDIITHSDNTIQRYTVDGEAGTRRKTNLIKMEENAIYGNQDDSVHEN